MIKIPLKAHISVVSKQNSIIPFKLQKSILNFSVYDFLVLCFTIEFVPLRDAKGNRKLVSVCITFDLSYWYNECFHKFLHTAFTWIVVHFVNPLHTDFEMKKRAASNGSNFIWSVRRHAAIVKDRGVLYKRKFTAMGVPGGDMRSGVIHSPCACFDFFQASILCFSSGTARWRDLDAFNVQMWIGSGSYRKDCEERPGKVPGSIELDVAGF